VPKSKKDEEIKKLYNDIAMGLITAREAMSSLQRRYSPLLGDTPGNRLNEAAKLLDKVTLLISIDMKKN
jgi:hypothetical protein